MNNYFISDKSRSGQAIFNADNRMIVVYCRHSVYHNIYVISVITSTYLITGNSINLNRGEEKKAWVFCTTGIRQRFEML